MQRLHGSGGYVFMRAAGVAGVVRVGRGGRLGGLVRNKCDQVVGRVGLAEE